MRPCHLQRLIAGVTTALLLAGCAPEQSETFCGTTADCADGYVCNAFTRRCGFDVANQPAGYQMWGSFHCLERTEIKDARGSMVLGLDPKVVEHLDTGLTEGFSIGYYASTCGLGFLEQPKVWFTGSSVKGVTSGHQIVMQLYIAGDNFASGTRQTRSPGAFAIAFVDAVDNKVLLSSKTAEITIEQTVMDQTPRGVIGEFRAKVN